MICSDFQLAIEKEMFTEKMIKILSWMFLYMYMMLY